MKALSAICSTAIEKGKKKPKKKFVRNDKLKVMNHTSADAMDHGTVIEAGNFFDNRRFNEIEGTQKRAISDKDDVFDDVYCS